MKIYIIVSTAWNMIESIWSEEKLAKQAVIWHARAAKVEPNQYVILEREVDKEVKE